MATWRRKALEYLPEMRRDINDPEVSIYLFFGMLTGEAWKAHDANDLEMLPRIYGFAEWCLNQPAQELWNRAGVSFYESLFLRRKDRADWAKSLQYLSMDVVHTVWSL
jgi:hypothetical protein